MSDNEVRLIDANALIEDLKSLKYIGYCNDSFSILGNREIERCISAVEDAPTADDWENYSTKLWDKAYTRGYEQAMSDARNSELTDRPTGEREFIEILAQYAPDDICTYPEYRGKPYYSIRYKQHGEEFVGFGTYNPEVLSRYLREYFMNCGADMKGGAEECG